MGPLFIVRTDAESEEGSHPFAILAANQGRVIRHVPVVTFLWRAEHIAWNQPQHLVDVITRLIHLELPT